MGQMMYFGGYPNKNLYSIIMAEDCSMERVKMPFNFYDGSCNSFMDQTKVLLCFSSDTLPDVDGCHM